MSEEQRPQQASQVDRPAASRQPWWHSGRVWLGLAISLACLVLALYGIDLAEVGSTLRSANPAWLAAAMAIAVAGTLAKAVRWRVLLDLESVRPEVSPSLPRLTSILLAGTAMNLALPAPRSGDLARAYLTGEAGKTSKSLILGTVAAEKLLDIVMLAVCLVGLLPFTVLPEELSSRRGPVVGLALFLILVVIVILWQRHRLLGLARLLLGRLPGSWGGNLAGSAERAVQGLDSLRHPRLVLRLVIWTLVAWLLSAAVNQAVFWSLGLPASWVDSFFVLVVLQAGVAVPSSPGKVGVFQVLCRWALMFLGYTAATGLAYGILLYLVVPVFYMVTGAAALMIESWQLRRKARSLDPFASQNEEGQAASQGGHP